VPHFPNGFGDGHGGHIQAIVRMPPPWSLPGRHHWSDAEAAPTAWPRGWPGYAPPARSFLLNRNYGSTSGGFDQLGFGTLVYAK
jgi:hypothetical protein